MMVFKPTFTEVTRAQSKASIVVEGLSGRGKSGLALLLAYYLGGENWGDVYALDTENRSLNLFEGIQAHTGITYGKFKWFNLHRTHGFKPSNYVAAKKAAIEAGAKAFVQDSISHAWTGPGGVLQLVNQKTNTTNKNNYTAWGEAEVVFEKDNIYEMIRDPEVHIISTVRMKEKHAFEDGKIVSLGEQQIQMPDLKYEPDLVLEMIEPGTSMGRPPKARVTKSRYAIFFPGEIYEFNVDTMRQLRDYLNEGADPGELMEMQRQEFIKEIKYILDSSESKRTVYQIYKTEYGVADRPLDELPLDVVRKLLSRIMV